MVRTRTDRDEPNCSIGKTNAMHGFTLIELAVVVFIISLLFGSILIPLSTQVESRKYDETQRILDQAREALIGYAAANGYFPCPASATSNGLEAGANHTTGACGSPGTNMYHGFLPAAHLGFTPTDANGYAIDAWGLTQNRIRYAVYKDQAGSSFLARVNGMRDTGMSTIVNMAMLYVCNSGAGATASACGTGAGVVTLTSSAPVVIWSVGPNAATTGGTSVDELQNPNPTAGYSGDRIFVSRTKSSGTSGEFDDIVTWIGTPTLFNRLIAAGKLP
jgi:prepilin-type N-terminal cleavage/methylation domain-containing protein